MCGTVTLNARKIIPIVSVIFAGCSSVSVHDPLGTQGAYLKASTNIVQTYYCVESTAQMNILDKTLTKEKNKDRFEVDNKASLRDIDAYFDTHITKSPLLVVKELQSCADLTTPSPDGQKQFAGMVPSSNTSQNTLYLTITLSGYGSLNERWKKLFIGSGIAEGLVQGIVVGSATQNPWFGVAVATEEFGQEYLTWNGIDWLMGETYAPVTLEGQLVLLRNKQIIWKDSSFVTGNEEELKNLSKDEKKKKEVQLKASLHEAEKELVDSLNAYLANEVLNR